MNSAFEKDFHIQDVVFSYNNTNYNDVLTVNSKPRRYNIIFKESESFSWLDEINNVNNFLLIDKNVKKILLKYYKCVNGFKNIKLTEVQWFMFLVEEYYKT